MSKPNIVFIMTDQLRADCLGYAGHPDVKTPYLDTLAARGVVFDHAYSACPSCIAARAALHTGMEQSHHGRVGYEDNIPWNYEHTMAGELSKAGYYTQCVGKMHVHPLRNYLGFHNVELHDGYLRLKQELGTNADVTDTGLDCNGWVARPWMHNAKYHPTNWVTDRSLDFLRRRDPRKPFFLMASYLRPHPPFDAPQYYFDLYSSRKLRAPFVGSWETDEYLKANGRIFDSKTGPSDPELIRQAQIGYYACITHLDHQIGRLIMALIEQEVYDNTVFIFTADHGEELCDHHMFRKSRPYEGSCHIPLFITAGKNVLPDIKSGSSCHSIAELRSLLPLTEHPDLTQRTWLHGEHSYGEFSNHWIVTEKDKYIWHSQSGREQYFDLASDPHELNDLISGQEHQDRIAELRSCLIESLKGRPEGFTDDVRLIPGRPYPPTLPSAVLP